MYALSAPAVANTVSLVGKGRISGMFRSLS